MSLLLRADPEILDWRLDQRHLIWLCTSLVLVLAPHWQRLPWWISLGFVGLCCWRLWNCRRGNKLPGRWTVVFISLAILPGVYFSYGTLTGRSAGIALLALLAGIKLLEARQLRDAYVLSFLGFFLIITHFLFDQSITSGAYMLGVVVLMVAGLSSFTSHSTPPSVPLQLRKAALMVAQSLPLMLILFVLFPRLPGPFWKLPKDATTASTGLGDELRPGSISQLSQSDAVAFRVRFDGPVPPAGQRYWRAMVYTKTDGKRWTHGKSVYNRRALPFVRRGPAVDYEITLEPHNRNWMTALELPSALPAGVVISDEFQIRSPAKITQRKRYRVRSYPNFSFDAARPRRLSEALTLPTGQHRLARQMALDWRRELGSDHAIVRRALDYFHRQPFVYTLSPTRLTGDVVDEFLFKTRQGFCQDFATAFTVLMRAAGIPARVVGGYQGGELNPLGDYLLVRQRDAHAWAEVWLAGRGWQRVDPTAAVAPERISRGIDAAIPPRLGPDVLNLNPGPVVIDAFRRLRLVVDGIQAKWNSWVLGYGQEQQRKFLDHFGLDARSYGDLVMALTVLLTITLIVSAYGLLRGRQKSDPVLSSYTIFCRKLHRRGIHRQSWEGPLTFAKRVVLARPDLATTVNTITDLYVTLRYGNVPSDTLAQEKLKTHIRQFQP